MIIDMHTVFVVDISRSVDPWERMVMMEGYGKALTSKDAAAHFNSGLHYALSVIYFADYAVHQKTRIVRSSKEAGDFAKEVFWDFENNRPQLSPSSEMVGTGTNILSAYKLTAKLYANEMEYGFKAQARSMIIAGDGANRKPDMCLTDCWTRRMAEHYGAVVYGIPILTKSVGMRYPFNEESGLAQYYAEQIATPPGLYYQSPDGFKVPVKAGKSNPVTGFSGLERTVTEALTLSVF